ncbi:helix-turn-helix domain-containing protein [Herbiconiux moechotypicola]|uniref:Helix-turn-helix domain-containing protein n=1 Tax=Herbiconiux moechotypicola TaxID=637393 RepID=A0ABN3DGE8_9MICO|nr:helix-turn-helix domain-containing protein [Herbiconiux moechotypicola]MCS5729458.1 helix-turn-helix domain-containing protein [Herbiconiux moechotypicola]
MDALLITPTEAAKSLGIGRSTIYELMAAGQIPSVKIGSSRRIRTSDLARYVDSLEEVAS